MPQFPLAAVVANPARAYSTSLNPPDTEGPDTRAQVVASTKRVLDGPRHGGCVGGVSSGSVLGRVAVSQSVLDVLGRSLGGVTVCGVAVGVAVVSLVGECRGVAVPVPQVVIARRAGVSVRSVLRWWPTVRGALAKVGIDIFDVGGGRAFWAILDTEHPVQVADGWAFPLAALVVGGHGGAPPGWSVTDRVRSVVWWSWSTPDGVLSRNADVDGLAARAATTPGGWRRWVADMTARGYIRGRCFDPGPWTSDVAVSTAEYRAQDRHSRHLRADPQRCGRWGGTTRWHGPAAIPEPVDLYTPAIDNTPSLYSLSHNWDLSSKRAPKKQNLVPIADPDTVTGSIVHYLAPTNPASCGVSPSNRSATRPWSGPHRGTDPPQTTPKPQPAAGDGPPQKPPL